MNQTEFTYFVAGIRGETFAQAAAYIAAAGNVVFAAHKCGGGHYSWRPDRRVWRPLELD